MATIAFLLGLSPAPIERCRVLELGCANATNLIAMAGGLPDSEFVGVDAAKRQVDEGLRRLQELGRTNVRVEHRDLSELQPQEGPFDYVIAHGVFSWVPPETRDRLLEICREQLAPQGVAYVSYNTYPGWSILRSIRDMMLFRIRHLSDPWDRAEEARRFVEFLAEAVPASSGPLGIFLEVYQRDLAERWDAVDEHAAASLLHDELEAINEPIYFNEFVQQAARHGLQYLAEASLRGTMPTHYPADVVQSIRAMARDLVETEQYLDFITNRSFRQTLLCHDDVEVQRKIVPDPERMKTLYVGSQSKPEAREFDPAEGAIVQFKAPDEAALTVDHAVTKAALEHLGRKFPELMRFDELLAFAVGRVYGTERGASDDEGRDATVLAMNLLRGFAHSRRLVELSVYRPVFTITISNRPKVEEFARHLASQNHSVVPNARHERVHLDSFLRRLVTLLDGTRDRREIVTTLRKDLANGDLVLPSGAGDAEEATPEDHLEDLFGLGLEWLAGAALLQR